MSRLQPMQIVCIDEYKYLLKVDYVNINLFVLTINDKIL